MGCTVAQAFYPETPHGVISGEFARAGQVGWAALCGRADSTRVVVAWGGPERCQTPVATAPNGDYLQEIGNSHIGFSRAIRAASNESIRKLAVEFDGPAPPSTDHGGINDMFVEKGIGNSLLSRKSVAHFDRNRLTQNTGLSQREPGA